ncbi:hypothetical protein VOLCADRAFT_91682 [Volvox carteri f. nagariensis]|uniref:Transcription initiation factor TFIID subunit 13 n=1 Tax=Volvox carteri f. nagariensis TaxID=3068 RepID=D8TXQ4_VOLCA|nr:uncharacterized protein VOLCADRAFT_91682 [Volvox carteri f. nagariensis]EFJ47766.1 hypothetical protein VOLCADRAFT_91682 [Volvox carteri f. nagariensis]|eukprot:XP_002951237.1 hypothetical protein VOLCADRAFT_91682 [Volvox carteri f. nagariensis]
MDPTAGVGTPPSASKGRGRRPGPGRGAGGGRGGAAPKDSNPARPGGPAGAAPGAAAAPAAATAVGAATGPSAVGAGASPGGTSAAASLGPAGGVAKKRGRIPKAKPVGEIAVAAAADSGPEDAYVPDTSMPYRGTFTKDLSRLMYGFGDYENPIQETINVVEDILVEYVRETCCAALNEAARMGKLDRDRASGAPKLKVDEKDILFLVRKDPRKYARIRELLDMQLLIKEARKTLDVDKISEGDMDAGGPPGAPGAAEEDPGEELPDLPDEDIDVE